MQFGYLHPADQLLMIMQRIYSRGMTTTSGGNLSIMDDDGNIWITPASIDKGTLTRKDIVCVKPNGEVVGIHKPSSELPFHASVYRRRPDLKAVLHAHPPALVAFSIVRKLPKMDLMPSTGKLLGKVAISEYAVPGSEQLGQNIAIFFDQGYDIVFLENHGVCIGGKSIFEAFQKFETLEYTASLEIAAKSLGETVSLSEEDIAATAGNCPCKMEEFENTVTPEELAVRRDMIPFIHRSYNQNLINATSGSFSVKQGKCQFVAGIGNCFNSILGDIHQRRAGNIFNQEESIIQEGAEYIQQSIHKGHAESNNGQSLTVFFLSGGLAVIFQEADT